MEVRTFNQNQKDNPHESVYTENHPKRDRTAESRRRARQRVESLSDDGREAKVAAEGIVLTEAQVAALERQKSADEAHGEIETAHPGYLGSQDTY